MGTDRLRGDKQDDERKLIEALIESKKRQQKQLQE